MWENREAKRPTESMKKHYLDKLDEQEAVNTAINRIASIIGKTPTMKEYKSNRMPEEPSLEQITYRHGCWSVAIKSAGLEPNPNNQPPRQPVITKEQLTDEFIRVANLLGRIPAVNQFRANAKFSWRPYQTNWGSWDAAVKAICQENACRFTFSALIRPKDAPAPSRRRPLSFSCPLLYEPQNEYETIVLFCFLAEELGFIIKSVQSAFPDAVLVKDGQEVLAEFEFLSSNYSQHCHPLDFDGIVICWRRDIDLGGIKILSIEEYLILS